MHVSHVVCTLAYRHDFRWRDLIQKAKDTQNSILNVKELMEPNSRKKLMELNMESANKLLQIELKTIYYGMIHMPPLHHEDKQVCDLHY